MRLVAVAGLLVAVGNGMSLSCLIAICHAFHLHDLQPSRLRSRKRFSQQFSHFGSASEARRRVRPRDRCDCRSCRIYHFLYQHRNSSSSERVDRFDGDIRQNCDQQRYSYDLHRVPTHDDRHFLHCHRDWDARYHHWQNCHWHKYQTDHLCYDSHWWSSSGSDSITKICHLRR